MLDAVLLSLVKAPVNGRRQLDILMTDAADVDSEFDPRLVRRTAEYSSTQMSFVITRGRTVAAGGRHGEILGTLRSVASTTGGQFVQIETDENLSEAFLAALDDFRTSYVLRVHTGRRRAGGLARRHGVGEESQVHRARASWLLGCGAGDDSCTLTGTLFVFASGGVT